MQNASWPDRILTSNFQFSLLCKEKYRSAKSLLYDKEQLQKIWRSDRGFGSTFRKQKAKRQHGFRFQAYFCRNWSLQSPLINIYCSPMRLCFVYIKDTLIWCRDISTYLIQLWRVQFLLEVLWELVAGCPKVADTWTRVNEKQHWGEKKKLWHIGCHRAVSNIINHLLTLSVLRFPYRTQFSLIIHRD